MFLVLLLVALTGPAAAEGYIGFYAGATATHSATVNLEQPSLANRLVFQQVPFSGRSFDAPIYYGYRAGFFLTNRFGLEAEFVHLKIHADLDQPVQVEGTLNGLNISERRPMRRYAEQFEVSHGLNMVFVNAVFRRVLIGPLMFIGRGGLGVTIPRPEVIILGVPGGSYQTGQIATQAAAGIQARLWGGLHLTTEYKYTFTPASFEIPNGRASVHAHSHHVATGFSVHF
jgi:lipid A oxidase